MDPITGTFPVTGDVVTGIIAGLPAGTGYTITLTASIEDITCVGSAIFEVKAGETVSVNIPIQCRYNRPTTPVCGNGIIETSEECDDGNTVGGDGCSSTCTIELPLPNCGNGVIDAGEECDDGNNLDGDGCSAGCAIEVECGNGIVEDGESCDTAILAGLPGVCPTDCNDGIACTTDSLLNPGTCAAACLNTLITTCGANDGCCPTNCNATNDNDCGCRCGNGVLESTCGETCDTAIPTGEPGGCPAQCDDGNVCTTDAVSNPGTCVEACIHTPVTSCGANDGCCPVGCNKNNDVDCTTSCGNGAIEAGETCDPPSSCPTSCDDGNICTVDSMTGSANTCNVACVHQTISQCASGDGCCPIGCNNNNDGDCTASCGNNVIEADETCDPPSSCPTSCNDGNACTTDSMTGNANTCNVACAHQTVTQCKNSDGCCPDGCNNNNDTDCTASCGNGAIETGETCDPPSTCPTSCNDGNACTTDSMTGSANTCNVACAHQTVTQCKNGDGCCPAGCNNNSDTDCSTSCGNRVIETGETCDPPSSCPTSCDDGNSCTVDVKTGSANTCNVVCTHQPVTQCASNDGCCPIGCDNTNDAECAPVCGNNVIEGLETCDPPSSCPTSCNDGNACTADSMSGSANICNVACTHQTITQCKSGDGCCPAGCTVGNDGDCSPRCGDGIISAGETCDPSSSCPTTCDDHNSCTIDSLTGSAANCNVACSHQTITQCKSGDGCCPAGCTVASDGDCSPRCGDGIISAGETCDPPSSCPTTCNDGISCTIDSLTGSASNCNVACSHQTITHCKSGDGCCPAGCNKTNDAECIPVCGNGIIETGEQCDDGNATSGDGCTATCLIEDVCVAPPDRCYACECHDCSKVMQACIHGSGVASKGPAAGTPKAQLCSDVIQCIQESECKGAECLCGTASYCQCMLGRGNGPCKTQIMAAAETTNPFLISLRELCPFYAIGRAVSVEMCSFWHCHRECW